MRLLTIGHGTAGQEELFARLRAGAVESVVDVRIAPGSRRHPHVNRDVLAGTLPQAGIRYRWDRRLGGFRRPSPDAPDRALDNDSFRGYAGWMRGSEFLAAVDELLADREARTAVMCSEAVWWRCHRRLIADFVTLARALEVRHLLPGGRLAPHVPTRGVRLGEDGLLVYDGPPQASSR